MPFIRCVYSGDNTKRLELGQELSKRVASGLGKPESVTFVQVEVSDGLLFGGSNAPCAMVHIEAIGEYTLGSFVGQISAAIEAVTGIPNSRIFLTFTTVAAEEWGFQGKTIADIWKDKS